MIVREASRMCMLMVLLPTATASLAQSSPRVVLNEILYDPPGPDDGHEYVELLNAGEDPVELSPDWRIERGNGARAADWASFWSGDGTTLDAGMRIVVGDDPRADRAAAPALQNGPDACRVVLGDTVIDLVGWGEHVYPEYHEGAPAPDPEFGLLVRRPDGADRDQNALDLVAGERETPGEPNFTQHGMGIAPLFPALAPPLPGPGERFDVVVEIRSLGLAALEPGRAGLRSVDDGTSWSLDEPLPSGGARTLRLAFAGRPPGDHTARIATWGDGIEEIVTDIPYRVGSGPVVVNEIMARPSGDEPEWVEIVLRSGDAIDLDGWTLADASGTRIALAGLVARGGPRVVTAEPASLLGLYPHLLADDVLAVSGWPSLNDAGETLFLLSDDGRMADAITFEAPPVGQSLERVHAEIPSGDLAAWVSSPRGPTPARENGAHADPPDAPVLTVKPPVIGAHGVEIGFHLGDETGDLRLAVIDPTGELRGVLLSRDAAAARGGLHWDGRIEGRVLSPGLYVLEASLVLANGRRVVRRAPFAIGWATGEGE